MEVIMGDTKTEEPVESPAKSNNQNSQSTQDTQKKNTSLVCHKCNHKIVKGYFTIEIAGVDVPFHLSCFPKKKYKEL
jgi:hypothetical protein